MVMGEDYCSRGCGFESQHQMDIILHLFVLKMELFFLKKDRNKRKEAGHGPLKTDFTISLSHANCAILH